MDGTSNQERLHRLVRSSYLSSQKFALTLLETPLPALPGRIEALINYLHRKEKESLEIEAQIEQEHLKEEQIKENEVVLQVIDYLGRKGFIRTAALIRQELHLQELIDIAPYQDSKMHSQRILARTDPDLDRPPLPQAPPEIEELIQRAYVCIQFSSLCTLAKKEEALGLCRKHRDLIAPKYLLLLVLSPDSESFRKLADECTEARVMATLTTEIAKITLKKQECMLYRRVALGVSGFITSACREAEDTFCPGCTPSVSCLANNLPKSMRSTTRLLCTKTKLLIPEDSVVFANKHGEVYAASSLSLASTSLVPSNTQFTKVYRRCYFV
ncbi:macrophage erythroblast attacher [Nematocida displodere]|uniref:Macrophage erythroblast attacher n=1 Tax=Nematocida displodere TaxID=1805483 RepID=A0A177EJP9_9MICR|nr:macrophage erythroblast attacher [Nematocida displodere]